LNRMNLAAEDLHWEEWQQEFRMIPEAGHRTLTTK
jgi:hypothetical protein